MSQLIEYGEVRRGSLGVAVQDLTPELREALAVDRINGAVITQVTAGSAVAEAGLVPGDVIVDIDGREVGNAQALRNIEGLLAVGSTVSLGYLREGRLRLATVEISEDLDARISGRRLDERLIGLMLVRVPDRSQARGVVVEDVRRNTPAWEAGLRAGDLIVAVNRQTVRNLREFRTSFPIAEDRELALEIRRRGRAYLVLL